MGRGRRTWLAVLVTLSACHHEGGPVPWQVSSATDQDDVRAATLQHVYQRATRGDPMARPVVCVNVEDHRDPSTRLLSRLSGFDLRIRKGSHCVAREGRVVDAFSGEPAIVLHVQSVDIPEPGHALATASYACGRLCGAGGTIELELRLGTWEVTGEHPHWVS